MEHLLASTLSSLPQHVKTPNYSLSDVGVRVGHIGATSNFFRSNIAPYFDGALDQQAAQGKPLTCGIVAIKTSNGTPALLSHLEQQNHLYTVVGRNGHDDVRVVGAVREIMHYAASPEATINRLADVDIITITGTQSAYYLNKDGKGIDLTHPDVQSDIANPFQPVTVPGLLIAAMRTREAAGLPPPMIISCDNIPGNGDKLGNVLLQYAVATKMCDSDYVAQIPTPNTMVDRITPQQNFSDNLKVVMEHGFADVAAIVCEQFSRWTIEQPNGMDDRLADLQRAGVAIVKDLRPFEDMKIRGLNGAHLALGLVGVLAGEELVHKALAQPEVRPFIVKLLDQAIDTVRLSEHDKSGFRDEVLGRFDNPNMPDRLVRLLTETSSKVSARLVNYPAINKGRDYEASAFAVAAWMRYMQGTDENSNTMPVADTRAVELGRRFRSINFNTEKFLTNAGAKIFDVQRLEGKGLDHVKPYVAAVDRYYQEINQHGVLRALERNFSPSANRSVLGFFSSIGNKRLNLG